MLKPPQPKTRWDKRDIDYFEAQPKRQISLNGVSPHIEGYILKELTNLVLVRITEPGVHQYELVYVHKEHIKEVH